MNPRIWMWLGTALDLAVFPVAAYMAMATLNLYQQSDGSAEIFGIVFLFFALPVFCIAAPLAAWRAFRRGRSNRHVILQFSMPLIYAAFLVAFVMQGP